MRDPVVYGEPPPVAGAATDRQTAEAKTIVARISADAELARNVSAISFVTGNRTPFFVMLAQRDSQLCRSGSSAFVLALREQPGALVGARMLPRFDHFWIHLDQCVPGSLWARTVTAWMNGKPSAAPIASVSTRHLSTRSG